MIELILGGARSGKSRLAERLAGESGLPVTYIATSQPLDGEMSARIAHHQARRPAGWGLIEEPLALAAALRAQAAPDRCLLVDCLTLWLTNLMLEEHGLAAAIEALELAVEARRGPTVLVSNEVGLGIVPESALARTFRDEAGRLHQRLAARAGHVLFMVAGIPMIVK